MSKANLKVVDDKKMDNSEKAKALDVAMSQIEQTYGKGSIMKLGQRLPWMLKLFQLDPCH